MRDYDWGISFTANEAEKIPYWLQLINWIYASEENYNFCIYGVEGVDWEKDENGNPVKLVEDSFLDDWFLQASKYVKYASNIPQENIEAYEHFDDGSKLSKTAGFNFDPTNVSTELALLNSVWSEYITPLALGMLNFDEDFPEILSKLKEAGLDTYLEEYQSQFSAWYAENH